MTTELEKLKKASDDAFAAVHSARMAAVAADDTYDSACSAHAAAHDVYKFALEKTTGLERLKKEWEIADSDAAWAEEVEGRAAEAHAKATAELAQADVDYKVAYLAYLAAKKDTDK